MSNRSGSDEPVRIKKRTGRECFESQLRILQQAMADFWRIASCQHVEEDRRSAIATIVDLDVPLCDLHKVNALALCERVTRKMPDFQGTDEEQFEQAFMLVYGNARERLIRNEYEQRHSSAAHRFMGEMAREGDAYFVDRFEVTALAISEGVD